MQARIAREPERGHAVEGQLPFADGVIQSEFRSEYTVGGFGRGHFHVAQPLESRASHGSHGSVDVRFQRRSRSR